MSTLREHLTKFRVPFLISAFVLLIMWAASAWAWRILPADARIPVHWSLTGLSSKETLVVPWRTKSNQFVSKLSHQNNSFAREDTV